MVGGIDTRDLKIYHRILTDFQNSYIVAELGSIVRNKIHHISKVKLSHVNIYCYFFRMSQ